MGKKDEVKEEVTSPVEEEKKEDLVIVLRFSSWLGNNVRIGIVGVPNVGKSSLFNDLSKLNVFVESL